MKRIRSSRRVLVSPRIVVRVSAAAGWSQLEASYYFGVWYFETLNGHFGRPAKINGSSVVTWEWLDSDGSPYSYSLLHAMGQRPFGMRAVLENGDVYDFGIDGAFNGFIPNAVPPHVSHASGEE